MDIRKKVASSTTNPLNDKGKDTNKNPQIKLLAECFSEKPKTMYQVEQETGVKNDNISRFIVKDEEKLYQTQGGQLETSLSHTGNSESMRATENTLRTISNYHY